MSEILRRDDASTPPRGASTRQRLFAFALLALFVAQSLSASLVHTATFDESAHIAAGLSYFETGQFKLNQQHPPLLKEIGALPLLLLGVHSGMSDAQWARVSDPPPPSLQWALGYLILRDHGPARVLFWARLPFIAIGTLLGWLIWIWGLRLGGAVAGFSALTLYVFDPTTLAHTALVTTDVGFAATAVLFLYLLRRWLDDRTRRRLLLCGGALGLALGAKFSAVFLLPIAGLLLAVASVWLPAAEGCSTLVDPYRAVAIRPRLAGSLGALAAMLAMGAVVVYALYFFPSNPWMYVKGLGLVNADHDPSYPAYLAGAFAPRFLSYYPVAWLLKAPLGTVAVVVTGVWALLRSATVARLDRAFLLVPPALLVVAYTVFSDNIGIRYVIPALPFLYLVGGVGFSWLLRAGGAVGRGVAVASCLWTAVAAAGIYPDHLSYANELACALTEPSRLGLDGGSRCGPAWFDDSNVDWGQGVGQLKEWLDSHPTKGVMHFAYFGTMRPRDDGISFVPVGPAELMHPPEPGRYVISGHFLARVTGQLRQQGTSGDAAWLLTAQPVAIVGHAYYVYDIP